VITKVPLPRGTLPKAVEKTNRKTRKQLHSFTRQLHKHCTPIAEAVVHEKRIAKEDALKNVSQRSLRGKVTAHPMNPTAWRR